MMETSSASLILLTILSWVALAGMVGIFSRIAALPSAGFGAALRLFGKRRQMPPRTGVSPVAIPPRHVSRRATTRA